MIRPVGIVLLGGLIAAVLSIATTGAGAAGTINPPPAARDWADIAKLPDWSGVWTPDFPDQVKQEHANIPPWTPVVAKQIEAMMADEKAGRPHGLFLDCFPEGTPSWMLISHNAMEFTFTPGRVTMLGESDGNRLRRAYIAISESIGIPNNGDLHVIEHLHLAGPNSLHDDLEIIAPHVLAAPWKTTRIFYRERAREFDIVEGQCLQGSFGEHVDKDGNAVFVPLNQDNGNVVPGHN